MPLTPEQRALRARIAAHARWAKARDRQAELAKATAASMARFEKEVDPDGVMSPAERAKCAENARKAYFTRLAFQSAKARAKQKEVKGGAEIDVA